MPCQFARSDAPKSEERARASLAYLSCSRSLGLLGSAIVEQASLGWAGRDRQWEEGKKNMGSDLMD